MSQQFLFVHEQIHSNHLKIINRFSSLPEMSVCVRACARAGYDLFEELVLRFWLELGLSKV